MNEKDDLVKIGPEIPKVLKKRLDIAKAITGVPINEIVINSLTDYLDNINKVDNRI